VVGFPGGGCLLLGDPRFGTAKLGEARKEMERRLRAARRGPLPRHLIAIATRTTGHWGRRSQLPASSVRAEAIARRAQRAVMSAPRLRYEERWGFCQGSRCDKVDGTDTRLVERERASNYAFARRSVPPEAPPSRTIRFGTGTWFPDGSGCWAPEPFRGALSTYSEVFLFRGPWSRDQRAAFFPPLRRWQLSYEPPRRAGRDKTELYWSSFFDRGTALVENATLRLLRVDRIQSTFNTERQRVSFSYPSKLDLKRPEPRCEE